MFAVPEHPDQLVEVANLEVLAVSGVPEEGLSQLAVIGNLGLVVPSFILFKEKSAGKTAIWQNYVYSYNKKTLMEP